MCIRDSIYTAPLSASGTVPEQLEKLYQQFNLEKPVDFRSPSMSAVSYTHLDVYKRQEYLNDPKPENMPILEDLYNLLREQEEKEAQYIATALEIYVTGSLNVFNHQSNVDIDNRIVCYDIKELGKQLKKIGMLVVQDQVWNRVTINRADHKSTRYYIDEMHLLLKEEQTAAYTVEIWKRFRKWGGIPTGITQNVKDLLSSREVENIFENSDFCLLYTSRLRSNRRSSSACSSGVNRPARFLAVNSRRSCLYLSLIHI